ncbi:MAG: hypothetical protein RDV48_10935 [Candidatus Eremiobacteraeota bacterium]|nr:hypothetical protein [Candidatus Eremiobacteraeota bacterium]
MFLLLEFRKLRLEALSLFNLFLKALRKLKKLENNSFRTLLMDGESFFLCQNTSKRAKGHHVSSILDG